MNWDRIAEEYLAVADEVFGSLRQPVDDLAKEVAERLRDGGKIMVCGNGGSAADAQHLAGEMVNKFLKERKPYAAIALSTDTSVISAIGNDFGYEFDFREAGARPRQKRRRPDRHLHERERRQRLPRRRDSRPSEHPDRRADGRDGWAIDQAGE